MQTILGNIVGKFTRQLEDLASESLVFILNQNKNYQLQFSEYLKYVTKERVIAKSNFSAITQATSDLDESRPDIIIQETPSTIIIEAKFWAGLTESQPVGYLERISGEGNLIFLVPERRLNSIRFEIQNKLEKEKLQTSIHQDHFVVNETKTIEFITWKGVVNSLLTINSAKLDSNLIQLKGLIDMMEENPDFVPFTNELFTPSAALQRDHLINIIDETIEGNPDLFNIKQLSHGGGKFKYLRFFKFQEKATGFGMYSSELWMEYDTPIWLGFYRHTWDGNKKFENPYFSKIEEALMKSPINCISKKLDIYDSLLCPIYIPLNVEKSEVLREVKLQIQTIVNYIGRFQ